VIVKKTQTHVRVLFDPFFDLRFLAIKTIIHTAKSSEGTNMNLPVYC